MPASPDWQFILTDLQGVAIGELTNANDVTVTLPLNRTPTVSLSLPLWHPRVPDILAQDTLLKCYRKDIFGTNVLVFNGPIASIDENGEALAQSLAVNYVGPFWRLSKRFIGQSKAGIQYGSQAVPRDLGLIAHDIIDTVNGVEYVGITKGTRTASTNGWAGPWFLMNAAEAIADLSVGLNSFDFEVAPTEPTNVAAPWPQIGLLNCIPVIGTQKPDAIFEYGTTRANVASYTRQITRDAMVNKAIISLPGWPDGVTSAQDLIFRTDTASKTAHGLLEDVVPDAGIVDTTLRTAIADEHLRWRAQPKQIVTFTPAVNARPYPFTDYIVGDWVRARAVVRGSIRFDSMFRIWGVTFKIDQNGNESLDLQLVQES